MEPRAATLTSTILRGRGAAALRGRAAVHPPRGRGHASHPRRGPAHTGDPRRAGRLRSRVGEQVARRFAAASRRELQAQLRQAADRRLADRNMRPVERNRCWHPIHRLTWPAESSPPAPDSPGPAKTVRAWTCPARAGGAGRWVRRQLWLWSFLLRRCSSVTSTTRARRPRHAPRVADLERHDDLGAGLGRAGRPGSGCALSGGRRGGAEPLSVEVGASPLREAAPVGPSRGRETPRAIGVLRVSEDQRRAGAAGAGVVEPVGGGPYDEPEPPGAGEAASDPPGA